MNPTLRRYAGALLWTAMDDARRSGVTAKEIGAVLAGLVALALVATFPLILHFTTYLPNDLGDPVLNAWILWWDATAVQHGFSHVWDAPSYFPYLHTLAYSDHLFGLAVFTAPVQWVTANPVLVYNIAFIASYANAGIGMYLLAKLLTGRRDPGGADVCVRRISRRPLRARAMAHDRVAAPEPLGASSLLLLRRVALPVRQRRRVSDAMSHGELFCILRAAAVGGGGDSRSVASAPA